MKKVWADSIYRLIFDNEKMKRLTAKFDSMKRKRDNACFKIRTVGLECAMCKKSGVWGKKHWECVTDLENTTHAKGSWSPSTRSKHKSLNSEDTVERAGVELDGRNAKVAELKTWVGESGKSLEQAERNEHVAMSHYSISYDKHITLVELLSKDNSWNEEIAPLVVSAYMDKAAVIDGLHNNALSRDVR